MKYICIISLLLISCSSLPKEIEPNYRIIDLIILNPDTLWVFGRDTIHYPNPNYPDEHREYREDMMSWFKPIAACMKANGYKIIDEYFANIPSKGFKFHQIQIQCRNNDKKATITFSYYYDKGYWKFSDLSFLGIWEHPDANAP